MSDATAKLSQSYNDYYLAMKKTNPKTPEDAKRLSDQTIGVARTGVQQAMKTEIQQAQRELNVTSVSGGSRSAAPGARAPSATAGAAKPGSATSEGPVLTRSGGRNPKNVVQKPEQVLDGSKIPGQMKFGSQ